jgi:hypothetical protein
MGAGGCNRTRARILHVGWWRYLECIMGDIHIYFSAQRPDDADPPSPRQEGRGDDNLSADVGERYTVIGPELLVEKGDEYLDERGRFVPFPLEAVGRRVPPGVLARRPLDR